MSAPDELADHLAEVAAQLVVRVRDGEPDDNAAWLRDQVRPDQFEALCFVLAAAVPHGPRGPSWLTLTAWTRKSPPGYVDDIAVERACKGEPMELSRAEVQAAVEILARRGLSDGAIAKTLGLSTRTVLRRRGRPQAVDDTVHRSPRETSRETSGRRSVA